MSNIYSSRKKPNPNHHNTRRPQPPKTRLASKINWIKLQLLGSYGNLHWAGLDLTRDPLFKSLKEDYQVRLLEVCRRARNVTSELKELADEIADLNSPDKWVN